MNTEPMNWGEPMVAAVLQKKFGKPEYAFLRQVRNATGYPGRVRTADALAMGLWPSRGLHLHGFEIKVSRSDWAHELKQPQKAEEIARYCHFWWLAVPDAEIVRDGELPAPWGLIAVGSGAPKIVKQATLAEHPMPPSMEFFASLLRSVSEEDTALGDVRKLMEKELRTAEKKGREEGENFAKQTSDRALDALQQLTTSVAEFEKESGIRIDRYSNHFSGEVGKAVQFLRHERGVAEAIGSARERLARLVEELADVESGLRAAKNTPTLVAEIVGGRK